MFFKQIKNFHKTVGILFLLLVIASFLFKGTSDLSVLLLSYTIMLVAVASILVLNWSQKSIQFSSLTFLLGIWLCWISIPPLFGWVPNTALFGIFQCTAWIFGFILFSRPLGGEWLWQNMLRLLYLLALLCALYALHLLLIRNAMPTGFFVSKNTAGAFLMVVTLLLIGTLFSLSPDELINKNHPNRQKILKRVSILVSIYILTFALLAVLSRGVIICFFCFAALEIVLCRRSVAAKDIYQLSGILLLALVTLFIFAQPAIYHRLELLSHEKSRLIIWKGVWNLWQITPWYGLGIFNFKQYYPAFSLPGDGSNLEYAHNDFLQLLIETGIPGVLILFGIIITFAAYLRAYLYSNPVRNPVYHINTIACFAALGALVCHSIIDFNFYVFPMNLLIGCCMGYLYYCFKNEGVIRVYTLPFFKSRWILRCSAIVFLLLISVGFISFVELEIYTAKTETAISTQQFKEAFKNSNIAQQWFNYPEIQSLKIDACLRLAQQATDTLERRKWIEEAMKAINQTILMNPYFARPYFQMALLQSILLNDAEKARAFFLRAIKNNAHFCLARLTFARFLIELKEFKSAHEILETGLYYPISPQYIEIYLNYLAKLRFKNGDQEGAEHVAQRLQHLIVYNQDYSDLIY